MASIHGSSEARALASGPVTGVLNRFYNAGLWSRAR